MTKDDLINRGSLTLCIILTAWIIYVFPNNKQEKLPTVEYQPCQVNAFEVNSAPKSCTNLTYVNDTNINDTMFWHPINTTSRGLIQTKYDRYTAIYDISAKTVYLPNGLTLEAHSGKGMFKDVPKYVSAKGLGPTPPHIYSLSYRERPFHGVQAIRLIPRSQKDVFNRNGLLAHPPFLGPGGDSHGCVTFKDYRVFLNAYKSGLIHRLAVVAKLD